MVTIPTVLPPPSSEHDLLDLHHHKILLARQGQPGPVQKKGKGHPLIHWLCTTQNEKLGFLLSMPPSDAIHPHPPPFLLFPIFLLFAFCTVKVWLSGKDSSIFCNTAGSLWQQRQLKAVSQTAWNMYKFARPWRGWSTPGLDLGFF